jgi:hypothetical protein
MDLWNLSINELKRSNADTRHPFRQMVFATSSIYPELRTVIKRSFDDETRIWFYSDSRAKKIKDITINPHSSILFYHPKKYLQLRISGNTYIHTSGEIFQKHFKIISQNPNDYNGVNGPGTQLSGREKGGVLHFSLLEFVPDQFDILMLQKDFHQRAIFDFVADDWVGRFVTP